MSAPAARPVVFLGPSLPRAAARTILDADYRPPVRRGDLADLPAGTVVALVDGVFDQELAVSPREVRQAVEDGLVVFGGASMGALRAAEVPGVVGVGRVHAWYRDGVISRDDEVALLFDPETFDALTVPTVNVRFAVERLARPGTIDRDVADRLLRAAVELPYRARTYRAVLRRAGLDHRRDRDDLVRMLAATDLKRADAQAVLEAVDRHRRGRPPVDPAGRVPVPDRAGDRPAAPPSGRARDEVLIWESGDRVGHDDLLAFLCFTGRLERYAGRALLRAGQPPAPAVQDVPPHAAQAVLAEAARRWGWVSPEEAVVTVHDLGLDLASLDRQCVGAARVDAGLAAALRARPPAVRRAVLAELFLDDLALKREAMRLGSLRWLADRGTGTPAEEHRAAVAVLCRANRVLDLASARARWAELGWARVSEQDAFLELVARARAAARHLSAGWAAGAARAAAPLPARLVPHSPKPPGEPRFATTTALAAEHAGRLGELIGVTRVGLIGELADLGGIQVAQAARPAGEWSSSYGSGKSTSAAGAIAGSVLEELEKWAQERFDPPERELVSAAYAEVATDGRFVAPDSLDLPYDSPYEAGRPLWWCPCVDLLSGGAAYLPVDVVRMRRGVHDICYSSRGSRKQLATNGLGAGFSMAEAALHATCEYIERHAQRMAELRLVNPGGLGPAPGRFVDVDAASPRLRRIARQLCGGQDGTVRVLDITGELAVPTFLAVLVRDRRRADGYGTHPDPRVAVEMALLEAAQTVASAVAGGREDLTVRARSLGRHERPRPTSPQDAWFWTDPDVDLRPLAERAGHRGADVRDDLTWVLARLRDAGVPRVLLVDLTAPGMAPAHVVRVVVPGLETNNPFHTGPRARLALLPDLLPRVTAVDRGADR